MKQIQVGQIWESKEGHPETSKKKIEILGKLNSKCWHARDQIYHTTNFISSDRLVEEFVIAREN